MKLIHAGLAALALASVLPAHAQTSTEFENVAMAVVGKCLELKPSATTAQSAVDTCSKVVTDMATLKQAAGTLAGHDQNVYLVVSSMAHSRVGNAYSFLDGGVRTARVCAKIEEAWGLTSQIAPAASPAYADMVNQLRTTTVSTIAKCRNEFGAPAGAAPLPPG